MLTSYRLRGGVVVVRLGRTLQGAPPLDLLGALLVHALELEVRHVAPVQQVVLHDEQNVEEDGEGTEAELGRVPEDGAPVVVVVADQ